MSLNLSGRHVRIFLNVDSEPITIRTKSVTVEEMATEVADDINGEDRQEFQKLTNGFRVRLSCFQNSAAVLRMLINNIANNDAEVAQLRASFAMAFHILDGTRAAFAAKELTIDPFTLNAAGMNERNMLDFGFRAKKFGEVKAV